MSRLPRILCAAALLFATAAFAQTYDLPLIIVNTQNGKTLEKGADKIPATMRILDEGRLLSNYMIKDLVGGNKDRIKEAPVLIVSTFERGKSGFFQGNPHRNRHQNSRADLRRLPEEGLRHRTQGTRMHERRRHGLPRHEPQGSRHAQERRLGVPRSVCR